MKRAYLESLFDSRTDNVPKLSSHDVPYAFSDMNDTMKQSFIHSLAYRQNPSYLTQECNTPTKNFASAAYVKPNRQDQAKKKRLHSIPACVGIKKSPPSIKKSPRQTTYHRSLPYSEPPQNDNLILVPPGKRREKILQLMGLLPEPHSINPTEAPPPSLEFHGYDPNAHLPSRLPSHSGGDPRASPLDLPQFSHHVFRGSSSEDAYKEESSQGVYCLSPTSPLISNKSLPQIMGLHEYAGEYLRRTRASRGPGDALGDRPRASPPRTCQGLLPDTDDSSSLPSSSSLTDNAGRVFRSHDPESSSSHDHDRSSSSLAFPPSLSSSSSSNDSMSSPYAGAIDKLFDDMTASFKGGVVPDDDFFSVLSHPEGPNVGGFSVGCDDDDASVHMQFPHGEEVFGMRETHDDTLFAIVKSCGVSVGNSGDGSHSGDADFADECQLMEMYSELEKDDDKENSEKREDYALSVEEFMEQLEELTHLDIKGFNKL